MRRPKRAGARGHLAARGPGTVPSRPFPGPTERLSKQGSSVLSLWLDSSAPAQTRSSPRGSRSSELTWARETRPRAGSRPGCRDKPPRHACVSAIYLALPQEETWICLVTFSTEKPQREPVCALHLSAGPWELREGGPTAESREALSARAETPHPRWDCAGSDGHTASRRPTASEPQSGQVGDTPLPPSWGAVHTAAQCTPPSPLLRAAPGSRGGPWH